MSDCGPVSPAAAARATVTGAGNSESGLLRDFEESERKLHAQINGFVASINRLYTETFAYIEHVNINGVLKRIEEWRECYRLWEPFAQDLNSKGRPELLHRLRRVQKELSPWTFELWQRYNTRRNEISAAQLAARRKWFEDTEAEHFRVQALYDAANAEWLKHFNRR